MRRCKRTEQSERLQGKIASISAAEAPQGRLKSAKRGFPIGFPHHVEDFGPSQHFAAIPTVGG